MATLTWVFVRGATAPAVIATLTATGITSGLLLWVTHRAEGRASARDCRIRQRIANLAGEVSCVRNDSDDRFEMQRLWLFHREMADMLFNAEDSGEGQTSN